ncbi:hypothetical protein ACJX0J_039951, partial [Zea mays]
KNTDCDIIDGKYGKRAEIMPMQRQIKTVSFNPYLSSPLLAGRNCTANISTFIADLFTSTTPKKLLVVYVIQKKKHGKIAV